VTDTAAGIELELKYAVRDRDALLAVLDQERLAGLDVGPERAFVVEDRYVDTRDRAIERAGFAARIRDRTAGVQLGLKSLRRDRMGRRPLDEDTVDGLDAVDEPLASPSGSRILALHRRTEVEGPATHDLDPGAWPESDARALLVELSRGVPLVERFRVRQMRRLRELTEGASRVELTVDDVEVLRDGETLGTFVGLEAELASGDETVLEALASALEATGLVVAEPLSKFELAAMLSDEAHEVIPDDENATVTGSDTETARAAMEVEAGTVADGSSTEAAPARARGKGARAGRRRAALAVGKTPGVRADDALAEAGRRILRFHLARMLAREEGTRSGADLEDLHGMRVATRRMRAAWRVFGDAYRPGRVRRYVGELRGLAADLGRVRDLDVLIDGLRQYVASLPATEGEAVAPLLEAWEADRERARRALVELLDSDEYRHFADDYVAFVGTEGASVVPIGPDEPHRVRDMAGSRIWDAYEHVRAYDDVLRWADIETVHRLRIAAKRLRYTIEFFREPLGSDVGGLIDRVVALQDHLGYLHDADVAAALARTFLVDRSSRLSREVTEAVGRYLRSREDEVARLRRTLTPAWRRVMALEFRRSLARAIGTL
jgi:CHAD domain-containing protein